MSIVRDAAAALAVVIVEPMPSKLVAAETIKSGVALKNDIVYSRAVNNRVRRGSPADPMRAAISQLKWAFGEAAADHPPNSRYKPVKVYPTITSIMVSWPVS